MPAMRLAGRNCDLPDHNTSEHHVLEGRRVLALPVGACAGGRTEGERARGHGGPDRYRQCPGTSHPEVIAGIGGRGGQSERVRSEKILRLCEAKARLIWKHWATMQARFGIRMLDMWCLTRMTATLVASKLSTRYEAAHEAWKDVWRARERFHGRNCGAGVNCGEAGLAGTIARG